LYTPLLAAKADDAKLGPLYLNDDTHWTPRGAELAAGEIAKKVREMADAGIVDIGEKSIDYVASDSLADRMGDIGEMSGLNKFNVFKVQQVTGHVVMQQNIIERIGMAKSSANCLDSLMKNCPERNDSCYFAKSSPCDEDDAACVRALTKSCPKGSAFDSCYHVRMNPC
jgi:hypothetical protein